MSLILPTSADWPTFDLHDGLGYVEGRLCELAYPELWQGCVGAWAGGMDKHPFDYSGREHRGVPATTLAISRSHEWDFEAAQSPRILATHAGLDDLPLGGGCSFTYWFLCRDISTLQDPLGKNGGSAKGTYCTLISSQHRFGMYHASSSFVGALSANLQGNRWYAFQGTYTTATKQGVQWINGGQDGTFTGVGKYVSDAGTSLSIGNTGGGGRFFNGLIADVRVYNRVISRQDIAALASERNAAYLCRPLPKVFLSASSARPWIYYTQLRRQRA